VRRRLGLILISSAALGLAGCEYFLGKSWKINQKLTVVVSTPNGEQRGSSVTQWKVGKGPGIAYSLGGMGGTQRGEALVMEVSAGRFLFALLGKPHPVLGIFPRKEIGDSLEDELDRMTRETLKAQVPRDEYPLLVTFSDINDPKTVKEVKAENLAEVFGPGFSLKSITLEITDEEISVGPVQKIVKWLGPYPEPPLCEPKSQKDFSFCAASVHHGDFIRR
jgi:hypothetical protein